MRNATDQVFQTAIISCLENPEMPFIFLRWRPGYRFTPESGHSQARSECPLSATGCHMHRSKLRLSPASNTNEWGTSGR
jgi:hypothetical protein